MPKKRTRTSVKSMGSKTDLLIQEYKDKLNALELQYKESVDEAKKDKEYQLEIYTTLSMEKDKLNQLYITSSRINDDLVIANKAVWQAVEDIRTEKKQCVDEAKKDKEHQLKMYETLKAEKDVLATANHAVLQTIQEICVEKEHYKKKYNALCKNVNDLEKQLEKDKKENMERLKIKNDSYDLLFELHANLGKKFEATHNELVHSKKLYNQMYEQNIDVSKQLEAFVNVKKLIQESSVLATETPRATINVIKEIIAQEHIELKHPEPIETTLVEWQWQDDDGTFKTYPSYISRYINECNGTCTISVLQNGEHFLYDIDIDGKTQTSRKYKKEREIGTRITTILKQRYNTQLILGNKIPKNWISQTDFVCFVDVPKTHKIYGELRYSVTDIISIQQVQCPYRLNRYLNWKDVHSKPNEKLMFHGTHLYPPHILLEELDGLDYRVSGSNKYLGYGTYFTTDLKYAQNFVYETAKFKQVIICEVALGNCMDVGTKRHPEMRKPPNHYDSVSGSSDGISTNIHCVYDNSQMHPKYIVTFK